MYSILVVIVAVLAADIIRLPFGESANCRKFDKPDIKSYADVNIEDFLTEDETKSVWNRRWSNRSFAANVNSARDISNIVGEIKRQLSLTLTSYRELSNCWPRNSARIFKKYGIRLPKKPKQFKNIKKSVKYLFGFLSMSDLHVRVITKCMAEEGIHEVQNITRRLRFVDEGIKDAIDTLRIRYSCVKPNRKFALTKTFLRLSKARVKQSKGNIPVTNDVHRGYKLRSGYVALLSIQDSLNAVDDFVQMLSKSDSGKVCRKAKKTKKSKKGKKKRKHTKQNKN